MIAKNSDKYFDQLPRYFFVTGGSALSSISPLNAFDEALMKAGIAQCNLVPVSSILPANAVEVGFVPITPGAIVFTIMARADGGPGDTISAGVAWAFGVDDENRKYGLVVEAYGKVSESELKVDLTRKIQRMATIRRMKLDEVRYRIETIEKIPENTYGCTIAAVVFVPTIDYDKVELCSQSKHSH